MPPHAESNVSSWEGPGAYQKENEGWARVCRRGIWRFFSAKGQRFLPTATGYVLVFLATAICLAAYNTASNILFIVLSLILAGLILSGLLSWINFSRVCWRIRADPPFRAGEKNPVIVEVYNGKRLLPTYALSFKMKAAASREQGPLFLEKRLDPLSRALLEWVFVPAKRGPETVSASGAVSEFPFGFFRKSIGRELSRHIVVWPRRIVYETDSSEVSTQHAMEGQVSVRAGQGNDLLNLRDYQYGDSQRLIHWKASARIGRLQVRQFAVETRVSYFFYVRSSLRLWRDEEHFERLCRFVLSLAEDFFQESRIHGAAINDRPGMTIRQYADLTMFFDELANLERVSGDGGSATDAWKNNVVTFEPYGRNGIIANAAGKTIASA